MDYLELGDKIDYDTYNGLVYLLRKFKRLTSDLKISKTISSDYGDYTITGGLTSVGGNFILEDDVTISGTNVLRNCFYTFSFSVVDVNLSGIVNKRIMSVTGDTGDNGLLEVVLEPSLLESDEVLLPEFSVDIVFDPHEYYTPVSVLDISLVSDKRFVSSGEVATVTATVLDEDGEPLEDLTLQFNVNGTLYTRITDENGQAFYEYTGTGVSSIIEVMVSGESLVIYDGAMVATVTGNSISLGRNMVATGDILIDWGDGTTTTRKSNSDILSTHTYTDGLNEHAIGFIGEITTLGYRCFYHCTGLTSIVIPNTVTSIGNNCFRGCDGLTSIVIPNSVTSLGVYCFFDCDVLASVSIPNSVMSIGDDCFTPCDSLVDYQLYWKDTAIIEYDENKMPVNSNTYFTIPHNQSNQYIAKNYPSAKLVERTSTKTDTILSIQSSKASYYTDESVTITGSLIDEDDQPVTSASVKIYQNNVLVDTLTTDSNGEYEKTLTGLSVGAYTFKAVYDGDNDYEASTSSNLNITVQNHTYSLSIASDKQSLLTTESVTISGTLLKDSTAYSSQSVDLYDGVTKIATLTTDSDGEYEKTLTGLSVGVHTFKAVHSNVESSTISVTVSEPTHTYSLSIASDKSSIITTESVTLSGQLLMDSSPYASQSIALYDGSTLISTLTTDSSGEYEETLTGLSVGTHTFKAVNSNVESSTVSVTVTEPTPVHDYSLTLASTKDILSYADSESATITATLTDNSVAVAGETLNYVIKHGSTTIDSGTDTTDNNGQISFTYASTGVGDVTIEVDYSTLLQETYALEDCLKYYPLTDNSHQSAFTIPSGTSVSYSSDGMRLSANAYKQIKLTDKLTSDCSVEFTLSDYSYNNYSGVIVYAYTNGETTPNKDIIMGATADTNSRTILGTRLNRDLVKGAKYRIEYTSSTLKVYENDVLLGSASNNVGLPTRFEWHMGANSRYAVYKDLKVKAL